MFRKAIVSLYKDIYSIKKDREDVIDKLCSTCVFSDQQGWDCCWGCPHDGYLTQTHYYLEGLNLYLTKACTVKYYKEPDQPEVEAKR